MQTSGASWHRHTWEEAVGASGARQSRAGVRMEGKGAGTPATGCAATQGEQVSVCVTGVAFEAHFWDIGKRRNK